MILTTTWAVSFLVGKASTQWVRWSTMTKRCLYPCNEGILVKFTCMVWNGLWANSLPPGSVFLITFWLTFWQITQPLVIAFVNPYTPRHRFALRKWSHNPCTSQWVYSWSLVSTFLAKGLFRNCRPSRVSHLPPSPWCNFNSVIAFLSLSLYVGFMSPSPSPCFL